VVNRCVDHTTPIYPQMLLLTLPTSGIVRLQNKSHGICLFLYVQGLFIHSDRITRLIHWSVRNAVELIELCICPIGTGPYFHLCVPQGQQCNANYLHTLMEPRYNLHIEISISVLSRSKFVFILYVSVKHKKY
jgi:hypothetical protein